MKLKVDNQKRKYTVTQATTGDVVTRVDGTYTRLKPANPTMSNAD